MACGRLALCPEEALLCAAEEGGETWAVAAAAAPPVGEVYEGGEVAKLELGAAGDCGKASRFSGKGSCCWDVAAEAAGAAETAAAAATAAAALLAPGD